MTGLAEDRRGGADENEVASFLFGDDAKKFPGGQKCRSQDPGKCPVPLGKRHFLKGHVSRFPGTGVGDERIDAAKTEGCGRKDPSDVRFFGKVASHREAIFFTNFLGECFYQAASGTVMQDHAGAFPGKGTGDR